MPNDGINLLPEELRDKKEKPKSKERTEAKDFKYTSPPKIIKEVEKKSLEKKSFLKRFSFGKKKKLQKKLIVANQIKKEIKSLPEVNIEVIPNKKSENFIPEKKAVEQAIKQDASKPFDSTSSVLSSGSRDQGRQEIKRPKITRSKQPAPVKKASKDESDIKHMEKTVISDFNLIPSGVTWERIYSPQTKIFYFTISILVALIICSVVYSAITWYEIKINNQVKVAQTEISDLENQINFYEENLDEMINTQKQLSLIGGLLKQHIYWTNLLNKIEKNTIDEVYYTDFAASTGSSLSLSAVGKNYNSVARQLVAFQQADFVQKVDITSANSNFNNETGESFTSFFIGLIIDQNVFLKD